MVFNLLTFRFIYIENISLPDVRCGRFTHKHVWIQPDDQFIFSTQRKGEPFYKDKTRCSVRTLIVDLKFPHIAAQVRYTPYGNCSEVGFTCDKMSVRNK